MIGSTLRAQRRHPCRHLAFSMGLVATSLGLLMPRAHAEAIVSWGSAQSISGTADVDTTGTLLYAYSFTSSLTGSTTVGGVPFDRFLVPTDSTTVTTGSVTLTAVDDNDFVAVMSGASGVTSESNPFAALPAEYKKLLESYVLCQAFDNAPGQPFTIQLGGLTAGQEYRVQIWSCATIAFTTQTLATGSSGVTLSSNTTGNAGGVGQFAIGTFVASGSSQTFAVRGQDMYTPSVWNFPLLNALQVREVQAVPEPSTWALALAGLGVGGAAIRRRHRHASGRTHGACSNVAGARLTRG